MMLAKKLGMLSFFNIEKNLLPITVIYLFRNFIFNFNIKLYFKIISCYKKFYNFRLNFNYLNFFYIGDFLPLNSFYINQFINISGFTKGKGFCGTVKKYHFKYNNLSHGNSKAHKKPGSIGMCQDPGRVFLGKKLPGRLGNSKNTVKNLKIIKIDFLNNILFIKGSLPGNKYNYIYLF